ncbi:MAG: carbohydrate kinase [Treponemataceae bacterium]
MILCCGEALIDMVPSGDLYRPCPGGSPYNSAVAIGRLGVPVSFLGRLAKDFFGDLLLERLSASKVRTDLIARSEQNSTLAFVKLEHGKEPQYAFYTADTADRSFSSGDLPARLPSDTTCILFGSISMTMEPVASTIEQLIQRERDARVISFDPNIRPIMIKDMEAYLRRLEAWIAASTIVKISNADIEFVYPALSLNEAIERILSLGPALVVVTLGKNGSTAVGKRGQDCARPGTLFCASAPVYDIEIVDTIGAGDTFHAAFLAWLEEHGKMSRKAISALSEAELTEALSFANLAASLVCAKRGAEPPTKAEMDAYAKKRL